jgi:molybdopterin/thiamine biosynthesis adenylyltransferase
MAKNKFHHEEILRGKDAIARFGKVRVVICGAGAIGSNLVDNLARQGFKLICLIDMDRVDEHNINTQTYEEADIGALKVNACQTHVYRTVGVEIEIVSKKLEAKNVKKLLKDADLVVDGFDNTEARRLVAEHCKQEKIPCLHAGLHAEYAEVVWNESYTVPQEDPEGDVCDYPLARNLILIAVAMATEEIVNFVLGKKERRNLSFTLKDLKIGAY